MTTISGDGAERADVPGAATEARAAGGGGAEGGSGAAAAAAAAAIVVAAHLTIPGTNCMFRTLDRSSTFVHSFPSMICRPAIVSLSVFHTRWRKQNKI